MNLILTQFLFRMNPRNDFRIVGSVVWIQLTQGKETCVDLSDWPALSKYRWCAAKFRSSFYAVARVGRSNTLLHKILFPDAEKVDHKDGCGLNNIRSNLRASNNSQNLRNRGKTKSNTSGYKGVCWDKRDQNWRAQIMVNYKAISLGNFIDPVVAARAYDAAAKRHHKQFARLNFP